MMNLVERLRAMGNGYAEPMLGDYDEAADRIERLEALVDEMAKVLESITEAYETDAIHKLLYRVSITK